MSGPRRDRPPEGEPSVLVARAVGATIEAAAQAGAVAHVVALHDHVSVLDRLEDFEEQIATLDRQHGPRNARPDHPWRMNAS